MPYRKDKTIMRAWAEINLDAIVHNYREIRKITNPTTKIMAIVKADGYGHGFKKIAEVLFENGIDAFGVATTDEAMQLRNAGFTLPVLILGIIPDDELNIVIENEISISVTNLEIAKKISSVATSLKKNAKIHIKLDTGMGRIGFVCGDDDAMTTEQIIQTAKLPYIDIEGVFSHFSKADESDKTYTKLQYKRFCDICSALEKSGITIPFKHICNSAGIIQFPEYHLDMVRSGIITYGLYPSEEVDKSKINLIPAMTVKTRVTNVKTIHHPSLISYGGKYTAKPGDKIATIAIGYADGFSRILSGKAKILIKGRKVNIVGNICMDQCMADVTEIPDIKIGDEVIIFGSDGNNTITVESVAQMLGTINYEVVCSVGKRVPRAYIQNNETVSVLNYLL